MKNHQKHILLIFIFVFFCLIKSANAATKYVTLIDNVNIRKGAGTTYETYKTGLVGSTYNLKNDNIIPDIPKNGNCDDGWYEIDYDGSSGYVCSSFVKVSSINTSNTPKTTCEKEMSNAGFPSSYWGDLCALKAKHPNWNFKAIKTNLDWSTAIEKQSSCGKSLVQTTNPEYLDNSCKYSEGSFKAASQKAIAYYMDPRNFLTENYIFQFEYLQYDNDLAKKYESAVTKMFEIAAFNSYHKKQGTNLANLVTKAGKESNMSPIALAARMYQELGTKTTLYDLYSGKYTGYDKKYYGYYNFYNIGVSGTCIKQYNITYCGLDYARRSNWKGVYAAVKGGATFLTEGYISKGQYTNYLQKFNVVPTNSNLLYTHQYMTNIAAPSSESRSAYSTYKSLGLLNSAFAFYIPVYTNMSANITNTPSGSTNNSPSSSATNTAISTIVTSAGYKLSGNYMLGIGDKTKVNNLISNLEAIGGNDIAYVTNSKDVRVNSGNLGTGYKVTIKNSHETKTYEVVIKGDTSGDGKINALDLLQIQKNILKTYKLSGAYNKAADPSGDGKINALDLLQVQKSILGTYEIKE